MLGFDTLNNRYMLEGRLRTDGALHIGAGVGSSTTDAPFVRMGNAAYIPGSSLRGVMRSTVERLMHAVRPDANIFCVSLETAKPECNSSFDAEELDRTPREDLHFCPMCRFFGSTSIASRLKVGDAVQIGKAKEPVLRDGVGIDRDTETAADQIKFDFEVLEPGPAFQFKLQVENVGDSDKALLLMMLVELKRGVDVGGKRSRGLGRVALEPDYRVHYFDQKGHFTLTKYLELGQPGEMETSVFEADLRAAFARFIEEGQGGKHVAARVA